MLVAVSGNKADQYSLKVLEVVQLDNYCIAEKIELMTPRDDFSVAGGFEQSRMIEPRERRFLIGTFWKLMNFRQRGIGQDLCSSKALTGLLNVISLSGHPKSAGHMRMLRNHICEALSANTALTFLPK